MMIGSARNVSNVEIDKYREKLKPVFDLREHVTGLKKEIENLEKNVWSIRRSIDILTNQLQQNNESIETTRQEIAQLEREIDTLSSKLRHLPTVDLILSEVLTEVHSTGEHTTLGGIAIEIDAGILFKGIFNNSHIRQKYLDDFHEAMEILGLYDIEKVDNTDFYTAIIGGDLTEALLEWETKAKARPEEGERRIIKKAAATPSVSMTVPGRLYRPRNGQRQNDRAFIVNRLLLVEYYFGTTKAKAKAKASFKSRVWEVIGPMSFTRRFLLQNYQEYSRDKTGPISISKWFDREIRSNIEAYRLFKIVDLSIPSNNWRGIQFRIERDREGWPPKPGPKPVEDREKEDNDASDES